MLDLLSKFLPALAVLLTVPLALHLVVRLPEVVEAELGDGSVPPLWSWPLCLPAELPTQVAVIVLLPAAALAASFGLLNWTQAVFLTIAGMAAIIDLRVALLVDRLTYPALWLALLAAALDFGQATAAEAILAAAAGWAVFSVPSHIYGMLTGRVWMGGGDAKLAAGIGALIGLSHLAAMVMLACLVGTVAHLLLRQRQLPFGPSLWLATVALCLCPQLSTWINQDIPQAILRAVA